MGIRVTALTIDVGIAQQLEVARREDRELDLSFTLDAAPVNMTGATDVTLRVRDRSTGILLFAREYSGFVGLASAGTPKFVITATDTATAADGPYDCDVTWTDANGYVTQLLVLSTFQVLKSLIDPTDVITSPPPIPLRPGADATFTGATNMAPAYWPSLGGTISVVNYRLVANGRTFSIAPAGPIAFSQDIVLAQVVATSINASMCQLISNVPFTGYVRVLLDPVA